MQDFKWGKQNHPDYSRSAPYSFRIASHARKAYDDAARDGTLTWMHILAEEIAEAREEASHSNVDALRKELVQVAAVAVSWIEAIDWRTR
jgi:hypothetical protein